jgi:hypothetical protein
MTEDILKDFDDSDVYKDCQKKLVDSKTRNFLLEFGQDEAKIAFDLEKDDFSQLIRKSPRDGKRPVRWM